MAMLAEPKRRQKWTLNPRGKNWSEDQNKFGQKMLEKMGWTQGKGLGAQEQGMQEHIRVKYKDDQAGIGFSTSDYDKNWIEKQSGFNDFLLQLQQANECSIKTDSGPKELSGKSLEMKSETSRARVHYTKFTRGKDVNKYNPKDLANIFGKKHLHEKYTPISEDTKPEEECPLDPIGTTDNRGGIVTIKGGNMHDYFKNKLNSTSNAISSRKIKKERSDSESELDKRVGFGFQSTFVSNEQANNVELTNSDKISNSLNFDGMSKTLESSKIVKKKIRSKENVSGNCVENSGEIRIKIEKEETQNEGIKIKIEKEETQNEGIRIKIEKEETQNEGEGTQIKKSKKKPKKVKEDVNCSEDIKVKLESSLNDSQLGNVEIEIPKKKKSKQSKKELSENLVCSAVDENNEDLNLFKETEVKKKRKKKNEKENKLNSTDVSNEDNENLEISNCDSLDTTEIKTETPSSNKKKKKSKSDISLNIKTEVENDKDNFAFENPCLMDVDKIDTERENSEEKTNNELKVEVDVHVVKKKSKKDKKKDSSFAFENPCLMDVNEIDQVNELEIENAEKGVKPKKPKRKKKVESEEYAFENPCLEDASKIDKEAKKLEKPKRKKINKENISVIELTDNSKNEELEEKNNFAFENPCLGNVCQIDDEAQKSKKRKRSIEVMDPEASEVINVPRKMKRKSLENGVSAVENVEECNSSEFEVPRKHFGLVNVALDLADEKTGKKRVTFNDKVEYNTDVENNKKPTTKLDKYEVDYVQKADFKNKLKNKIMHTKRELQAFFLQDPVLQFTGSNVNELKGYGN